MNVNQKKVASMCLLLSAQVSFADCKTDRTVFLDNSDTKVWQTVICPNEKLPMHRHDFARVVIPKSSGTLKVSYKNGQSNEVVLTKGVPEYLSKEQGMQLHQDVNVSNEPIKVIVVEIKEPSIKQDKLIGHNALPPKYLSVPGFQKCLSKKDMGSWQSWCIPVAKNAACELSSWQQLQSMDLPKC